MHVDLILAPNHVDDLSLREKTVVVIDVLRASTTVVAALMHGARQVIPAPTVESAVKIAQNLPGGDTILGGERNGRPIEGFALGNSPAEYTGERVRGKSIIFSSTNGSPALARTRYASEVVVGAFVNLSQVVRFLRERPRDVTIFCAGHNGGISLEDTVCAGLLASRLMDEEPSPWTLSDGGLAALTLARAFGKGLHKMLRASEHGRFLEEIGCADDLRLCAELDTMPVLPQMEGNVLRLRRDAAGGGKE